MKPDQLVAKAKCKIQQAKASAHLKNGHVSTKRGPEVMWTNFRLSVCAAEQSQGNCTVALSFEAT